MDEFCPVVFAVKSNMLPPKTESDENMEKGRHFLEILSETHKKQALEFMEFLLRQEENDL